MNSGCWFDSNVDRWVFFFFLLLYLFALYSDIYRRIYQALTTPYGLIYKL
jgi:hypothetical protein